MNISRREFAKGLLGAPAVMTGLAGLAGVIAAPPPGSAQSPIGQPAAPRFKPVGVDRSKVLKIYSARKTPDITPVFTMWEQLTGMRIDYTFVPKFALTKQILAERNDPQADVIVTNSMAEAELMRPSGVFDPHRSPVAQRYPDWLRAPDYSWLSFSGWPRSAMVNWATLGRDPAKWPKKLEDLAEPEFRDKVVVASMSEAMLICYVAALRIAKGDEWTGRTLDRLLDNGMRIYKTHFDVRKALVRERYDVALVNSENNYVFALEGNAIGEAWLDQEPGGVGTYVDADTIGVIRGARQPEAARNFVDLLLSKDVQELFVRLDGEAPVNPEAGSGWARQLSTIRRIAATPLEVAARYMDTQTFLKAKGFDMSGVDDPIASTGRTGLRRDKLAPGVPPLLED